MITWVCCCSERQHGHLECCVRQFAPLQGVITLTSSEQAADGTFCSFVSSKLWMYLQHLPCALSAQFWKMTATNLTRSDVRFSVLWRQSLVPCGGRAHGTRTLCVCLCKVLRWQWMWTSRPWVHGHVTPCSLEEL